jgi:nucleoside-diphosphate-sugar epimerase
VPVVAFERTTDPWRLRLVMGEEGLSKVSIVDGDVTDLEAVGRVMDEHAVTNVIHLAALQVPFVRADPPYGGLVNVVGTMHVFEAVKARRDRISRVTYAGPGCSTWATLGSRLHRASLDRRCAMTPRRTRAPTYAPDIAQAFTAASRSDLDGARAYNVPGTRRASVSSVTSRSRRSTTRSARALGCSASSWPAGDSRAPNMVWRHDGPVIRCRADIARALAVVTLLLAAFPAGVVGMPRDATDTASPRVADQVTRKMALGVATPYGEKVRRLGRLAEALGGNAPAIWVIWSLWGDKANRAFPTEIADRLDDLGVIPMIWWEPANPNAIEKPYSTWPIA